MTMECISDFLSVVHLPLLASLPLLLYGIYFCFLRNNLKPYPPGPREWGISWKVLQASMSGTLPWLATEWAKKYGPITYVCSFGQPIILLNSPAMARKLIGSDEYKHLVADRAPTAATLLAGFNGKDLFFSKYDATMRKKRRIFYTVTGLYGDGVAKFENAVWGVMETMFVEIDSKEGTDLEITKILVHALKRIISILAIGSQIDEHVADTLEEYDISFNKLCTNDVDLALGKLPFLAQIPGKLKAAVDRFKNVKKQAEEIMYFNPKKTHIPGQPRGIIDLLLDMQRKPGYEWLDDPQHVIGFLAALFMAAHLSSRAAINALLLCLLNDPAKWRKIQKEVDTVIGSERPSIAHKHKMPYTEAAIVETLRILSLVPLSGIRRATQDFMFEGISVPKNTLVLLNSWYYLHDETIWEDPWRFKPERFLDNEGNLLPADHPIRKNVIVFGLGVRQCPGETFARSRMFIMLSGIIQRYDLHPPVDDKLMPADFQNCVEDIKALVRQLPPFKCRLTRRFKNSEQQ